MSILAETVFTEIEEVAGQIVKRFNAVSKENQRLRSEVSKLKEDLMILKQNFNEERNQVKSLGKERKKPLAKVENILKSLKHFGALSD